MDIASEYISCKYRSLVNISYKPNYKKKIRSSEKAAIKANYKERMKISKALELPEQLKDFPLLHGHKELSLTVSKAKDLLDEIELRSPKSQTTVTDFGVEYDDKDACLNLIIFFNTVEPELCDHLSYTTTCPMQPATAFLHPKQDIYLSLTTIFNSNAQHVCRILRDKS